MLVFYNFFFFFVLFVILLWAIYVFTGGIYASPSMAGSRPGGLIAAAWFVAVSLILLDCLLTQHLSDSDSDINFFLGPLWFLLVARDTSKLPKVVQYFRFN